MSSKNVLFLLTISLVILQTTLADSQSCSNGHCKLLQSCLRNSDCGAGLYCFICQYPKPRFFKPKCVRSSITNQFKVVNNSLPFNKYAFLTTHNSFASKRDQPEGPEPEAKVPLVTLINQEDSITEQLHNGVRALMVDTYDYKGDIWLCHSFKGKCHAFTAFERAIDAFKEIQAFLSANPSEIVTLILEDYVTAPNGLTRIFKESGLMKYWFPLSRMPKNGQDWPLVKDMVAKNQRLIVFTSMKSKEKSEGIAYQWNYMVENQYGNQGMEPGRCPKRNESAPMNDRSKSLVLVNHFKTIPLKVTACEDNSEQLLQMLQTCHAAAGNRWANFIAVDYYKRSAGGGSFQAVDTMNGELMCGCSDIYACAAGSSSRSRPCKPIPTKPPSDHND